MPKTPQDHKKKAEKPAAYSFEVDGVVHTLPSPQEAAAQVNGRAYRDAVLDGDNGQARLGFLMLEASGADPAAVDALYDMPVPVMLERIAEWMSFKAEDGASVGESSGSSS